MTLNQFRSLLYTVAKFLGDYNAVRKGRIGRRILRPPAGKGTGRLLGKIFR